jgi:hypothetical protein
MQGGQSWYICYPSSAAVWSTLPPATWGSSSLNAVLWFRRSSLGSATCHALEVAYCCVFYWELRTGSLVVCSVMWGGFLQARDSGCWKFDSGWCFISAWWRKEKRRKEKKIVVGENGFPDLPCWLCHGSQLLGATKGWFEGQSLNFFLHLM